MALLCRGIALIMCLHGISAIATPIRSPTAQLRPDDVQPHGRNHMGASRLRPSSQLNTDCFGWPQQDLNCYGNNTLCPEKASWVSARGVAGNVSGSMGVNEGEPAIDFYLHGVQPTGNVVKVHLGSLLQAKPVVLIPRTYSCPIFQGISNCFWTDAHGTSFKPVDYLCDKNVEMGIVDQFYEDFTFLHYYPIESHPLAPHTSSYEGLVLERPTSIEWHNTFAGRLNSSTLVLKDTHPYATLLLDGLSDDGSPGQNNPLFCTYSMLPRSVTVIAQNGMVAYSREWIDPVALPEVLERIATEHASQRAGKRASKRASKRAT